MQAILEERAHLHPEDPPRIPQSKENNQEKQQNPRVPQNKTKILGRRPPADVKKLPSSRDNCNKIERKMARATRARLDNQIANVTEAKLSTVVVNEDIESTKSRNIQSK